MPFCQGQDLAQSPSLEPDPHCAHRAVCKALEKKIMGLADALTPQQQHVEERLRTCAQCLCGLAVVAAGLYYLRSVLIPLVLALAPAPVLVRVLVLELVQC